jgi:hypothetical protein
MTEPKDPTGWWLISKEDVASLQEKLLFLQSTSIGGMKPIYKSLLHTLETGLHQTDEVPDDWKRYE